VYLLFAVRLDSPPWREWNQRRNGRSPSFHQPIQVDEKAHSQQELSFSSIAKSLIIEFKILITI
jgi:hypothetical protein